MAALNQPNVKAIWDDIERITPSGLVTRQSERPSNQK
jgi:hypothetical protein